MFLNTKKELNEVFSPHYGVASTYGIHKLMSENEAIILANKLSQILLQATVAHWS